jgi:hypothetical protein
MSEFEIRFLIQILNSHSNYRNNLTVLLKCKVQGKFSDLLCNISILQGVRKGINTGRWVGQTIPMLTCKLEFSRIKFMIGCNE